MGSLIGSLVPLALGAVLSPLAVVAAVAILLSHRPGPNGWAFLIGWTIAVIVTVTATVLIASQFEVERPSDPPRWVAALHVLIGLVLVLAGGWMVKKGRRHIREMAKASAPADVVSAAPQLPGWLKSVEHFQPGRCLLLGFALFAFNPVDLSCAVGAGLNLRVSDAGGGAKTIASLFFLLASMLPAAIPVIIYAVKRESATPTLMKLRTWIAGNSGLVTAAMLLVIGVLQLVKGIGQF